MHKAFEEILEAIWAAGEEGHRELAEVQAHCPIEVRAEVLAVLQEREHLRLNGSEIALTPKGRETARGVVRRHRLATTLFATILDMDADKREAIACEVEHTLLPEVEEAICTLLGHPETSPDNKPIPPGHCCETNRSTASTVIVNLTSLAPGERGRITYIKPKHHTRLHKLTAFGLTPGTVIEVHQRSPAFCVRYEGTELALNRDVAEDIFVARMAPDG
jgi:DtxR family transcriptional regulator, Mn-dependent transcriptional regulator